MIPFNAKSWSESIADTMTMFAGFGNRISLVKLCRVLGIDSPKDGIDGSKVYDYLLDGKVNEVAEYCKRDIEATREAYRRLSFI
jgi:predicted PolB exonuclease-like 3'-5' exonuclease